MSLLKDDGSLDKIHKVRIIAWPIDRLSEGLGLSIKDGWNFGIGFGLAMVIAVPIIILFLSCLIGVAIVTFGSSLGALF